MARSALFGNAIWLGSEFLKIFYNPVGVAGGFIDAFRGWKFSRSWVRFWFNLPSLILLVAIYIVYGFSASSREDSQIQLFSVESQKRCTTQSLEATCDQLHEEAFVKVAGDSTSGTKDYKTHPITDLSKRYVELLSKRVISIQSRNQVARYRLGMIYAVTGRTEEAVAEMSELANGKLGDCPQANAWMAKELLSQMVAGVEVPRNELVQNLETATKWKDVDYRLISFYAQLLEKAGDVPKAILVAKQAAKMKPELHLELARLYSRLGYQQELKSAAATAEDVFMKRLNSPSETESDRIAVAEARRLTDRLQQAADILNEGLLNKSSGPKTKRDLSEIQRLIYAKSIFQTEAGLYDGDVALLEKAADTDPLNPNISTEIAKLLPMKIAKRLSPKMLPTKKLVDTLKEQVGTGIASYLAHIILAEVHFADGKIELAIKDWEVALSKDPNNVGVMNNLSLILAKTSASNIDRSLQILDKALSLSQNNAELLDTLGDVLMIAQRPKEAINKYELAVLSDHRRIGTRRKLVVVYRANGMEEMAKTMEAKIVELEREIEIETEKAKADEEAKAQEKPK